jgi:hypothetical protein
MSNGAPEPKFSGTKIVGFDLFSLLFQLFTIHSLACLFIIWCCYSNKCKIAINCKKAEEYVIHAFFCIISNPIGYYFWTVVWSAYKEIKAENVNFVQSVPYPKSQRTKLIGQDIKMITYKTTPTSHQRAGGSNLNQDVQTVNRNAETGISIIFNAFDPPKTG